MLLIGLVLIASVVLGACLLWLNLSDNQRSRSPNTALATTSSIAPVNSSPTSSTTPGTNLVVMNGISFEIATSTTTQMKGLSGRPSIPDNYAMLFVFPKDGTYGFWMKDMLVPIDMVWVSDNGHVLAVDSSVSPATYPHVFYPPQPVRYVLETQAGFSKKVGWSVGRFVTLPARY